MAGVPGAAKIRTTLYDPLFAAKCSPSGENGRTSSSDSSRTGPECSPVGRKFLSVIPFPEPFLPGFVSPTRCSLCSIFSQSPSPPVPTSHATRLVKPIRLVVFLSWSGVIARDSFMPNQKNSTDQKGTSAIRDAAMEEAVVVLEKLRTSPAGLSEEEAADAAGGIRSQRSRARKKARMAAPALGCRPQPARDFADGSGDCVLRHLLA